MCDLRHRLAELARNKKTRVSAWSAEMPTDWRPESVLNPESGFPFTGPGAWAFVVECLAGSCPMETISLTKPPNTEAYVLKQPGYRGRPAIYIKVHFGNG